MSAKLFSPLEKLEHFVSQLSSTRLPLFISGCAAIVQVSGIGDRRVAGGVGVGVGGCGGGGTDRRTGKDFECEHEIFFWNSNFCNCFYRSFPLQNLNIDWRFLWIAMIHFNDAINQLLRERRFYCDSIKSEFCCKEKCFVDLDHIFVKDNSHFEKCYDKRLLNKISRLKF